LLFLLYIVSLLVNYSSALAPICSGLICLRFNWGFNHGLIAGSISCWFFIV
jgi:hypothetical protein